MSQYKPYPAYRDSGVEWIGQVPEHWQVTPLKVIADTVNGATPESGKPEYWDGDIAWYTPTDIDNEVASELGAPRRYITQAGYESCAVKLSPPGSVILSTRAPIGSVGTTTIPSTINQGCRTLIPAQDVPTSYLASTLVAAREELRLRGNGTTFQELSTEALRSLRIPMPPFSECVSIASGLDRETTRIDTLITKKTRSIELLKEKRQALITHVVTKGLDPNVKMRDSGIDWIGEVPEEWSVVQVRHVATLGSGHTPSRSRPDWWEDCYIPWFTLADIWQVRREGRRFVTETEEKVSDLGIANSSAVVHPAGSVMLSRTASVGFPAIMGCDMATSQDFAVWRCGSRVVNEYLYLVLLGMKQELSRLMIGSTHKTIYMPDIEAFRMPLPPVEQQKLIIQYVGDELQRFDTLIAKTQLSIDLLKERRSAFITAAVTGQIDLREAA